MRAVIIVVGLIGRPQKGCLNVYYILKIKIRLGNRVAIKYQFKVEVPLSIQLVDQ